VEAVFEGTEENVALMIDWCRTGPPSARVTDVEITREEATHSFSDFTIRYD
jgi:acylphosphatase